MKRHIGLFLLLAIAFSAATAQETQKSSPSAKTSSQATQIIDRELFFGNPEIAAAQISPNGKYISFLKPWKDTRNIYVKGVNEPFTAARLLTTESHRPIPRYYWSREGERRKGS